MQFKDSENTRQGMPHPSFAPRSSPVLTFLLRSAPSQRRAAQQTATLPPEPHHARPLPFLRGREGTIRKVKPSRECPALSALFCCSANASRASENALSRTQGMPQSVRARATRQRQGPSHAQRGFEGMGGVKASVRTRHDAVLCPPHRLQSTSGARVRDPRSWTASGSTDPIHLFRTPRAAAHRPTSYQPSDTSPTRSGATAAQRTRACSHEMATRAARATHLTEA